MILKSEMVKVFRLYYDGFKKSPLGKKLLIIVCIKLFVLFVVFKLFFFKNDLRNCFDNDTDRGNYVIEKLTWK